ncbi:ARM repeat-containing protein [Hesseltinella vesiculosa]|uniref:ARM repeat-containing protein n=1 Tax=Hesseltinella vesiculosa TaxID=101127 RepID=A0A1X2GFU4_9FUNG|nr:ARM repeat-containing protein [Hesseltinella vesiculosa]
MSLSTASSYRGYLDSSFLASGHSQSFYSFIKKLNQSSSKEHEYTLINHHLKELAIKLRQPNVTPEHMKEALTQVIHCYMLGYNVDFSLIHAIMMTQSGETLDQRRLGYLVSILLLNKDGIMLINTLQRDLKSANFMDNCLALTAICYLDNLEWMEHVLEPTLQAMSSSRQVVRRKAVMALYGIYQQSPTLLDQIEPALRNALVDKDLGVVFVALSVWCHMVHDDISLLDQTMLTTVLQIHQQILDGHLEKGYLYHGVPAPWAQMNCLKLYGYSLAQQGHGSSQIVFNMVMQCLHSVEKKVDAAFAILLECLSILGHPAYHDHPVDPHVIDILHPFVSASNANRLYLGLSAIAFLDVSLWQQEWSVAFFIGILCSHVTDNALVPKCLEVLDKRLKSSSMTTNHRQSLVSCLTSCAGTPHHELLATWLLRQIPDPELTLDSLVSMLTLIHGSQDAYLVVRHCRQIEQALLDEADGTEKRIAAADLIFQQLGNIVDGKLPFLDDWALFAMEVESEHGYLSNKHSELEIMNLLESFISVTENPSLQVHVLYHLRRCIQRSKQRLPSLDALLPTFLSSPVTDIQQAARELTDLVNAPEIQTLSVLPSNAMPKEQNDWCDIQRLTLSKQDPSIHADQFVSASVSLPEASQGSSLIDLDWQSSVALDSIDTDTFGRLWIHYGHEQKQPWQAYDDVDAMVEALRQQWPNSVVVATVQQECLAAVPQPADPDQPILLHAHWKSPPAHCKLTVRTPTHHPLDQ